MARRKSGSSAEQTNRLIYQFIREFTDEHGYPPTFREISEQCFITLSAVSKHLTLLEQAGKIYREFGKARGITLLDDPEDGSGDLP